MATSCFCGCGRPVRLGSRKLNKHGEMLTTMLMGIHAWVLPQLDPEPGLAAEDRREVEQARANMESMADEGAVFRAALIEVLHDEASVRTFDHRGMLAWIRAAGKMNSIARRR